VTRLASLGEVSCAPSPSMGPLNGTQGSKMKILHGFVFCTIIGCGGSSTTGTSKQIDDASISAGGSGGAGGTSSGGGSALEAGSLDGSSTDVCDNDVIRNVVRSRAPASSAEAGGPPPLRRIDGSIVFSTPTDPCVTYARPDCSGGPRSIFGCPTVITANGSGVVHPGDQITVQVPITDDGLTAYSCHGLATDQDLVGGSELVYGVKPAYVQESGQIPPSTALGTVYHFTAVASGSRYTSAPETACGNDLTKLDFDVIVE